MEFHTLSDNVQLNLGTSIAVTAAATHGAATDCFGFRRAAAILYAVPSGTGTTVDAYIEECATTGGSYTKVTGSDFTEATTVGGASIQMVDIDLAKRQRFLKVVVTGAGGSAAGVMTAFIILGEPQIAGTTNTPAGIHV